MKYIIDIIQIDSKPEEYFKRESWPSEGLYRVKDSDELYHVYRYGVNYISDISQFIKTEYIENPKPSVTEELFLKSLAAINGKISFS
jgi:hypothetical protein